MIAPACLWTLPSGLLGDAEQLALGASWQPGAALVEREVHPQVAVRAEFADVLRQRAGEASGLVDLVAQVEDGEPELTDEAGDLGAQVLGALTGPGVGAHGGDLVGEVAEGHDPLGDAVVDVAGEPVPLLGCGEGPDVLDEQRGLEPDGLLVQLLLHGVEPCRREGCPPPQHDGAEHVLADSEWKGDRTGTVDPSPVADAETGDLLAHPGE